MPYSSHITSPNNADSEVNIFGECIRNLRRIQSYRVLYYPQSSRKVGSEAMLNLRYRFRRYFSFLDVPNRETLVLY